MKKRPQLSKQALLKELSRRKKEADRPIFDFVKFCFRAQIKFFNEGKNRFRTAVCSRRAGKTVGIAADMLATAQDEKDVNLLYITVTQHAARAIIWTDILRLIEEFEIDCKPDHAKLTVSFPSDSKKGKKEYNGSKIYIAGAKDRTEIEKYRGWKLRKCYIDECQSFRAYLEELINDIIIPALRDLRGELYLTGTPGPVKAGTFYKYSTSKNWDNHYWTAFDNPHMHDPEGKYGEPKDLNITLAEERIVRGIDESDPSYIRETFGKWVEDEDSLVFKFSREKNRYTELPTKDENGKEVEWSYIMGVDIGFEDSDAIAVLGFNHHDKRVYIVDEFCKNKQTITDLMKEVQKVKEKWDVVKIVMDAGALGKKIQEEIRQRHGIHMESAEKSRKIEFIELLNDDLRTGKLKAFYNPDKDTKTSLFEDDCYLVQWDKDSQIRNPERPKVSSSYHSDICDAVLYAWRECRHYLSEHPHQAPKHGTPEWMDEQEKLEAEKMQRSIDDPEGFEMEEEFETDMDELQMLLDTEW